MELSSEGFCLFLAKQLLLLCRMTGCSSLGEVSVRLDCLSYKSFPPLFSPKQVSDNSTDLTRLFFWARILLPSVCQVLLLSLLSNYPEFCMTTIHEIQIFKELRTYWISLTPRMSDSCLKDFLDRRAGANKNYRFPFFFNHWSDNLFCRIFYLNANLSEYESQEGTFLPISLS